MMTPWHQIRRIIAATLAFVVAAGGQRFGLSATYSILLGISVAILVAGLILPLFWKPPPPRPPDG
jgi:hypothetical protein